MVNFSEEFDSILDGNESILVDKLNNIFMVTGLNSNDIIIMLFMIEQISKDGFIYGATRSELFKTFLTDFNSDIVEEEFNETIDMMIDERVLNEEYIKSDLYDKIDYSRVRTYTLTRDIVHSISLLGFDLGISEDDAERINVKSSSDILLRDIMDPSLHGSIVNKFDLDKIKENKINVKINGVYFDEKRFIDYLKNRNNALRGYSYRNTNTCFRPQREISNEVVEIDSVLYKAKSYGRAEGINRRLNGEPKIQNNVEEFDDSIFDM